MREDEVWIEVTEGSKRTGREAIAEVCECGRAASSEMRSQSAGLRWIEQKQTKVAKIVAGRTRNDAVANSVKEWERVEGGQGFGGLEAESRSAGAGPFIDGGTGCGTVPVGSIRAGT